MDILIKVLVLLPFSKTFDYISSDDISEGDVVKVSFGKSECYAIVVGVSAVPDNPEFELKRITSVTLKNIFSKNLLNFIKVASHYNCGTIGMFLRLSFPFSRFRTIPKKKEFDFEVSLTTNAKPDSLRSKLWQFLWSELQLKQSVRLSFLKASSKDIARLVDKELVSLKEIVLYDVCDATDQEINLPKLSCEQEEAFNKILNGLHLGFKVFLLDGETGSGKTEVYFHLIKNIIQNNEQVLLTLPEIALSSNILLRFKARFGFDATLWHSSVSENKRINNYTKIINGDAKVIIGTRSSIFLPFKNLKLIIVDEEHDSSYKQEDVTIYNGRDMAVMRGYLFKIPVLLGSATPSVESFNNVQLQKYILVPLKNRFFVKKMPKIKIVDMKVECLNKNTFISPSVISKLLEVIGNGGQVMLFLNRRGYAPIVTCNICGEKIKCKFCDVHLTEHRFENKLKCHYCGFVVAKIADCPSCNGKDCLKVIGVGVERIKEELGSVLDPKKIILLTSDTISSEIKAKEAMLAIETGNASVIVGTQVVSKGYHFPNLKFVAILDADFGLNIEDFRAFEKTFQLLYQVSGRTGRETEDGEVYIQTYDPKNKTLFSIANYDKQGFYALELQSRQKFKLPPFAKQIAFVISSEVKESAFEASKSLSLLLEEEFSLIPGFAIFGPSTPIISFLRGKYRFRILILSTREFSLQLGILKVKESWKIGNNVSLKIDIDPITFY